MPNFSLGPNAVIRAIAASSCVSIVGGGDTVAALEAADLYHAMSHVSTGGGASLEFLGGRKLPGLEALTDRTA
jgi:phosphoglycerate kinase